MERKIMTPIAIKYALEEAGYSQNRVAEICGVSQPHVSMVIYNRTRSHRVRCEIAKLIGRSVDQIWDVKKDPSKIGRPLTRIGTHAA